MPDDSIFIRQPESLKEQITIYLNGQPLKTRVGDSVAAALLAAGHSAIRKMDAYCVSRGPFCMMGSCYECLIEIDGKANIQACMTEVRENMKIRTMRGTRSLDDRGDE